MNLVRGAMVALVVVWLQLAVLPQIGPWGVVPNLALVMVLILTARLPAATSLALAATIGWLLDVGAGSDYGLRTAFYVLVALATVTLSRWGSDLDNFSLLASLVAGTTVLFNLALLANLAFLHAAIPLRYVALRVAGEIMLNLVLLLPVRWSLAKLMGRRSGDILVSLGGRRG